MLIRGAEVWGHGLADVLIEDGRIAAIGPSLHGEGDREAVEGALSQLGARRSPPSTTLRAVPLPVPGRIIEARGGVLLPGLHDHHIHLASLAVRAASVACGPPEVHTADDLARQLQCPGDGWIRGIGYHESVMGLPERRDLDALVSHRPLRIQHRSGRLWLLNSLGLDTLLKGAEAPAGLDREKGHLFDEDRWLQDALGSTPPDFARISADLARFGVTGLTDMTPHNGAANAAHFGRQLSSGALRQRCVLAGELALADEAPGGWTLGPAKLHLHEAALPDFDEAMAFARAAHAQNRGVAIHCVSEVELVFALALLEEAGALRGDRIEHVSVAAPELVTRMEALVLAACVQPHFVAERGDRYLADVEPQYHGDLYRLRSLGDAGIPLAGGSDAPFGSADPWNAMAAAVSRRTREGQVIGAEEALSPEEALGLYLVDPLDFTRERHIAPGQPADLCLLDRPWAQARESLSAEAVRATLVSGKLVHDRVDQPPA